MCVKICPQLPAQNVHGIFRARLPPKYIYSFIWAFVPSHASAATVPSELDNISSATFGITQEKDHFHVATVTKDSPIRAH
mmetsp:Transcript_31314/g.76391  ORF Transcript_31314/g.76391 Transcript_31314/m.76391 type:complete len:80 (-) Transcript_31314:409-648(-)